MCVFPYFSLTVGPSTAHWLYLISQNFEAIQLLVKHSEEYKVPDGNKKNKENYYKSIQFR